MFQFASVWQWHVFPEFLGLAEVSLLQVVVKDDSGFSGLCQMELPPDRTVECQLTGSRVQDLVCLEYEPKLV